jgi:hypothetical protein
MSAAEDKAIERAWPLWKEQAVFLVLAGNTQQEVVDILSKQGINVTRQAISAMMKTDEAKSLVRVVKEKFRENLLESIEDQLDAAAKLALRSVKRTLSAEISPTHKAKPNQDRVAIKVLQGRGFLSVESETKNIAPQVPPEIWGKLVGALEKSARVGDVDVFANSGPVVEAEIIEEEEDDDAGEE